MKFCSHWAVIGILGLLEYYGQTYVEILLPEACMDDAGYVYIIEEASPTEIPDISHSGSMFKIIGSSGTPFPNKITTNVPGQFRDIEQKRYPVSNCIHAIEAVLTAVRSEYGEYPPGAARFSVTNDRRSNFVLAIERVIGRYVWYELPLKRFDRAM